MNYCILMAGGVGNRVGAGIPKQFVEILGKPVIAYTMQKLQKCGDIDAIVLSCVDGFQGELQKIAAKRNVSEVTRPQNSASKFDESDSPSKGYWNKRREALEVVARYPERAAATLQNWVKDA